MKKTALCECCGMRRKNLFDLFCGLRNLRILFFASTVPTGGTENVVSAVPTFGPGHGREKSAVHAPTGHSRGGKERRGSVRSSAPEKSTITSAYSDRVNSRPPLNFSISTNYSVNL